MKIWVIGRCFPTVKYGMIGSFEYEQAVMFAKRGHDVTFITVMFHPFKTLKKRGFATWNDQGVSVCTYSQYYTPERCQLRWRWFQEKTWKHLLNRVEKTNGIPDVIHVHYPAVITVQDSILAYKEKNVRLVLTEHWSKVLLGNLNDDEKMQLIKYVERADGVISVGEPLKSALVKATGTNKDVRVIPNVVSSIFAPVVNEKNTARFTFAASGRLIPDKQFDGIIKAFAGAFCGKCNISLILIGGGPETQSLQELVNELGIEEQVTFTGVLQREDVARVLAKSDCLVSFSRFETFGVPIIEAWACGIPVIGTDRMGVSAYIDETLGRVVSSERIDQLAEAMKNVILNRNLYSKTHISEFAQENFGEDAVYHQLLSVYQ